MSALSEQQCRDLAQQVLELSRADEAEVSLADEDLAHLRFARNSPSTGGLVRSRSVRVRSTFGTRSAAAEGNQLDRSALETLVRRSEELARRAPEDPEFVPALERQEYVAVPLAEPEEESERRSRLAQGVERCIDEARSSGLVAAGYVECAGRAQALANSAGLFGYHRGSSAHLSETVRTSDGRGSGWASSAASRVSELDFAGVSRAASAKARASAGARPLEPGTYPALLEPACVASLLALLIREMDARSADEGRSFFAREDGRTRLGEALFPEWAGVRSDPADPRVPTLPWGAEGLAHRATDWIRAGSVANLHSGRFWAAKMGRAPLPEPPNLLCEGGEGSTEDLLRSLERGIWITSLWYIREVDPRTMLYTGLTRDGVFWIERGEVAYPVHNFRWNESPVRVLANALGRSASVRIGGRGGESRNTLVPALHVGAFELTSVSEAV